MARGPSRTAGPGSEISENRVMGPRAAPGQKPGRIRGITEVTETGTSPARGSPGPGGRISNRSPPALLLAPPGGGWGHHWGSWMPHNGLGRQNLSMWAWSSVAQPSQALTRQPSTMALSDRQTIQPFQTEGIRAGIPCTSISLWLP